MDNELKETLDAIKNSVDNDIYLDLISVFEDQTNRINKAINLILTYDVEGEHHKQWLLTQVLKELCGQDKFDRIMKSYDENENYGGWDKGIAP